MCRRDERFRLDIIGLTSTHSTGSETNLLERGWTLFHTGVFPGERWRAGVGLLTYSSPTLCMYVGVNPSEREGCFPVPTGLGIGPDRCLHLCAKRQFRILTFFGVLGTGGDGTWNPNGPCSALPLLRRLFGAAAASLLERAVAVIPKPAGGHQR